MSPSLTLRLYSKPDCPLCDRMKAVVERVAEEIPLRLVTEDISRDEKLWERHWRDIPVLELNGRLLFRHRLTRRQLMRALLRELEGDPR